MTKNFSIGAMLHPESTTVGTQFSEVRALGLSHVQLGYNPHLDSRAGVSRLREVAAQNGVEITTVFCGFAGESYADIASVQRTVGLVPTAWRKARLAKIEGIAAFARQIGVSRVAAHIGCIPEDNVADWNELVEAVQHICDDLAVHEQVFALETGQETAAELLRFIDDMARPNLTVNFDPANMVLYGNDEPNAALNVLMPYIDGVHCKDGLWPTEDGQLGEETPLGEGDVNFRAWLSHLIELGYDGPLTIEREISGEQQKKDIALARGLIEEILSKVSTAVVL